MMSGSTVVHSGDMGSNRAERVSLARLVGAGDRIGKSMLPLLVVGIAANVLWPALFGVGGPQGTLRAAAIGVLAVGVVVWAWSVALILTKVPKRELITTGPFALVKHPLYTGVGLLVLPAAGVLLDTWLGALLGVALYVAARVFAPEEERALAEEFGPKWDSYAATVKLPWL